MGRSFENRTTYLGILNLSHEYIKAFIVLNDKDGNIAHFFHVKFYLLAHSIELSFKAYLRYKGYSLKQLKLLGHDLEAIYLELTDKYLYRLDETAFLHILNINQYYRIIALMGG